MTIIDLRDYQRDLVEQALTIWEEKPSAHIAIQLPTGGGKTRIGMYLLEDIISREANAICGWMTDRKVLRTQSGDVLSEHVDAYDHTLDKVGERLWRPSSVGLFGPAAQLSMPQKTSGLLVVDEMHHSPARTWSEKIKSWPGPVLGLSATPWRLSPKMGFDHLFSYLLTGPSVTDLIAGGYLAQPIVVWPHTRVNKDALETSTSNSSGYTDASSDFQVTKLLNVADLPGTWDRLTKQYARKDGDRRTLWYAPSVNSAQMLKRRLEDWTDEPESVGIITAETSGPIREQILNLLAKGNIQHVVSVNTISEGVDLPSIPVVCWVRPSLSLVQWMQACGRAMRPKKDENECLIIDFAATAEDLGLPDFDRTWSLEPRDTNPTPPGDMINPGFLASCLNQNCFVMMHPAKRKCTMRDCGTIQYYTCPECGRDRRWTQYSSKERKACVDCDAMRKQRNLWFKDAALGYDTCFYDRLGLDKEEVEEAASHHEQLAARLVREAYEEIQPPDAKDETARMTLGDVRRRQMYDDLMRNDDRKGWWSEKRSKDEYVVKIGNRKFVWNKEKGWIKCIGPYQREYDKWCWVTNSKRRTHSFSEAQQWVLEHYAKKHARRHRG